MEVMDEGEESALAKENNTDYVQTEKPVVRKKLFRLCCREYKDPTELCDHHNIIRH